MTTSLYIQCAIMFILGQGIDLFLIKIPEYRELWAKSNEEFSWKKYWGCDWNVIIGTLMFGAVCIIGADQLLNWRPEAWFYAKWVFAGLGGFGSAVIIAKWGRTKKFIMKVIDEKTDIADKKTDQ